MSVCMYRGRRLWIILDGPRRNWNACRRLIMKDFDPYDQFSLHRRICLAATTLEVILGALCRELNGFCWSWLESRCS